MKTIKLLLNFVLAATLFTSCYTEVDIEDSSTISLNQLLDSYELWYVDINKTVGYGETRFLQKAFTVSFRSGTVFANNNIVGLGDNGGGFGIAIGGYDTYNMILNVNHNLDGFKTFDIFQIDNNTIELYNPNNDTSYFLEGYQRSNFDYNFVFYDNIHYFLQEYEVWEKTYTSDFGAINEFDNQTYLQFLAGGNDETFRSSQDENGIGVNTLIWDYTGIYRLGDSTANRYLKMLTLDYDFLENEYFELTVITDDEIELYHPSSKTVYKFEGRGYIQYLKTKDKKGKTTTIKKRKYRKNKVFNPRENTRVK